MIDIAFRIELMHLAILKKMCLFPASGSRGAGATARTALLRWPALSNRQIQ